MADAIVLKRCGKCETEKPLDAFHKCRARKDGYHLWCKACRREKETTPRNRRLKASPPGRIVSEKHCPACNRTLPASDFYSHLYTIDKLDTCCIACKRSSVLSYRSSDKGRQRYDRWIASGRYAERKKAWRSSHPLVIAAHNAVRRAKSSGVIPFPCDLLCRVCGSMADEYHHHLGYEPEHWLDVIPLCFACHDAIHARPISGPDSEPRETVALGSAAPS